jgi:flagellar hook-length control protein FliK
MEADSFNQQSQQESQEFIQANSLEIKNGNSFRVNNKIQIYKNPVSLNELSNVLAREVTKINPKDTQELTMSLTPGDMGQIELTITKDANNKLEIKMVFSQENALNTVEHKLTELRTILKSRGFEAQIELSKSESASTDNFNRPRQDSYNEAKEEQKEKILHSMPEWLRPDDSDSFQNTLQQII